MKYSIIIPAFNGGNYLKACVDSIWGYGPGKCEIIVSDDNSTDGSCEFLKEKMYKDVVSLKTPRRMSMAEHWDWAQSHARGEWQIFVGQDDGLQPFFFPLADHLTEESEKRGIRTIVSARALFFWAGCEEHYGDVAISVIARPIIRVCDSQKELKQALLGRKSYFHLPTMYTTSLFHQSLIEEARAKQGGPLFVTHPQDANLAAMSVTLEKKFLRSEIPLGWVGSSVKSAGLAVVSAEIKGQDNLKDEYENSIVESKLRYNDRIGNFKFASLILYFWGALLMTASLRSERANRRLTSNYIVKPLLSAVGREMYSSGYSHRDDRVGQFEKILAQNGDSLDQVMRRGKYWYFLENNILLLFGKIKVRIRKILVKLFPNSNLLEFSLLVRRSESPELSLSDASKMMAELSTIRPFDRFLKLRNE